MFTCCWANAVIPEHRGGPRYVHSPTMKSSLRLFGVLTLVVLVVAACGGVEAEPSDVTETSAGPATTTDADVLAEGLMLLPPVGGPWQMQPDDGVPVHLLQPVCGAAIPGNVPLSGAHAGRMYFSGPSDPLTAESFPIARHSRDRFADGAQAAAFIDIHRQALTTCDSWTYEDDEVAINYTVATIDIDLPGNGVAFEVTEQRETERLVNLTAMFRQNDVVSVIYYVALDEADPTMLEELIAEAEALLEVHVEQGMLDLEEWPTMLIPVEEINEGGLWVTNLESSAANDS